ncbi:MAG: hypothetical protein ACLQM8_12685 [Limisphaerales bacterium]
MSEDAFVLWLDMLGYKAWLERQTDLEAAERWLKGALSSAFERVVALQHVEPRFFNIDAMLVSDTIVLSSHRLDPDIFISLVTLYQLLHCELVQDGLPLRGALAKGPLRISRDFPHTVIGEAISRCAQLEHQTKAFVVAVDSSFMDFLKVLPEPEAHRYMVLLSTLTTIENDKEQKQIVLKWFSGLLPYSLMRYYDRLVMRGNEGDLSAVDEFLHFCPKLLNSKEMIKTVHIAPDDTTELKHQWDHYLNKAAEEYGEFLQARNKCRNIEVVAAKSTTADATNTGAGSPKPGPSSTA